MIAPTRKNYVHTARGQVARHCGQYVIVIVGKAIDQLEVLAFHEAEIAQPLAKGGNSGRPIGLRSAIKESNSLVSLLRKDCERPNDRCTAEKDEKFTPLHVPPIWTTPGAIPKI